MMASFGVVSNDRDDFRCFPVKKMCNANWCQEGCTVLDVIPFWLCVSSAPLFSSSSGIHTTAVLVHPLFCSLHVVRVIIEMKCSYEYCTLIGCQ